MKKNVFIAFAFLASLSIASGFVAEKLAYDQEPYTPVSVVAYDQEPYALVVTKG